MQPGDMLDDPRLSHCDLHVFAVIFCGKPNSRPWVEIGERLAAKRARVDRRTFRKSRDQLVACGGMEALPREGYHRARYRPTAAVFNIPGMGRPSEVDSVEDWAST